MQNWAPLAFSAVSGGEPVNVPWRRALQRNGRVVHVHGVDRRPKFRGKKRNGLLAGDW